MLPIKHKFPGVSVGDGGNLLPYTLTEEFVQHFAEAIRLSNRICYSINCVIDYYRHFSIEYRDKRYKHKFNIYLNGSIEYSIAYTMIDYAEKRNLSQEDYYNGTQLSLNLLFEAIEDRIGKPIDEITNGREHHR